MTLYDNMEEYRSYSGVNKSTTVARIEKYIQEAFEIYIVPIMGNLSPYMLKNSNVIDPELFFIQKMVKSAVGALSVYRYLTMAEVQIDDNGARRVESDTVKTPYKYQTDRAMKSRLEDGLDKIERLLELLETNSTWLASDFYQQYSSLYIRNGKELSHYITVQHPRRMWLVLASHIRHVEDLTIAPIVPDYSQLNVEQKGWLGQAIACLSMANALPTLQVEITDKGVTLMGANNSELNTDAPKISANTSQLEQVRRRYANVGSSYLRKLEEALGSRGDIDFDNGNGVFMF